MNQLTKQWTYYKYSVMDKDYSLYKKISKGFNNNITEADFYYLINQANELPYNQKASLNTFMHLWGYFKKEANLQEKDIYLSIVETYDEKAAKVFIKTLATKYQNEYLLQSAYLINI